MSKALENRQDSRKNPQLTIQTLETRSKSSLDWKALEIKPSLNRPSFSNNQISQFIDDSDLLETNDTFREIDLSGKKNTKTSVKNPKISNESDDKIKYESTYEATQKKVIGSKKQDQKSQLEKLQAKIDQFEVEIDRLKEENSKLSLTNKKLETMTQFKKERISFTGQSVSFHDLGHRRRLSHVPSIQFLTQSVVIEDDSTQIQKLKAEIIRKDQQIRIKERQSTIEKSLVYQNINNRLKAKQIQCLNLQKELQGEKSKIQELESKVEEYEIDIQKLNEMLRESADRIAQLSAKSKQYEEQISKKSLLVGRIRHLDSQNTYFINEAKKYKQQINQLNQKNSQLISDNSQLRSQLLVYLSNSVLAPYAEIYSLAKQLIEKDIHISEYLHELKQLRPLQAQSKNLNDSLNKTSILLEQANNELVKEKLQQMSLKFKNSRLF